MSVSLKVQLLAFKFVSRSQNLTCLRRQLFVRRKKGLSDIVSKRMLHRYWRRSMTKLPNNEGPSGDKSEHSRDIVEKAREINADEDRSSVYDLMGLLAKAGTAREARSLTLNHDDIDDLHRRLDSIDRKITFFGEVVIAVLAVIVCVVNIKLANAFLTEPFEGIAVAVGTLVCLVGYGLMRYLFHNRL
jgi:hypothetical protein